MVNYSVFSNIKKKSKGKTLGNSPEMCHLRLHVNLKSFFAKLLVCFQASALDVRHPKKSKAI